MYRFWLYSLLFSIALVSPQSAETYNPMIGGGQMSAQQSMNNPMLGASGGPITGGNPASRGPSGGPITGGNPASWGPSGGPITGSNPASWGPTTRQPQVGPRPRVRPRPMVKPRTNQATSTNKPKLMYMGRVPYASHGDAVKRICNQVCKGPRFKFSGHTRVMNKMPSRNKRSRTFLHRQCGCVVLQPPKAVAISAGFMGAHGHPNQYCPEICRAHRKMWNGGYKSTRPHFNDHKCMCIPANRGAHLTNNQLNRIRMIRLKISQMKQMNMPLQLGTHEQRLINKVKRRKNNQKMLSAEEELLLKDLDGTGMAGSMNNPMMGGGTFPQSPPVGDIMTSQVPIPPGQASAFSQAMPGNPMQMPAQAGAGAGALPSSGGMDNPMLSDAPIRQQAKRGSNMPEGSTARIMLNNPEFRKFAAEQGYRF